jgi:hypothetical protein
LWEDVNDFQIARARVLFPKRGPFVKSEAFGKLERRITRAKTSPTIALRHRHHHPLNAANHPRKLTSAYRKLSAMAEFAAKGCAATIMMRGQRQSG